MLDIKLLREEAGRVKERIAAKNADPGLVDRFLELDGAWRALVSELDLLRAEQKKFSAARDLQAGKANKEAMKEREARLAELEREREEVWMKIPNLPSDDTPVGKDESANTVVREWGEPRAFSFPIKDHVALGEHLGILDIEHASKVAGTRFNYLMGDAVRLEFALVQWVLDVTRDETILKAIAEKVRPGYSANLFVPVVPPVVIRPEVFRKMARLEPRDDRFHIESDDLYLIGSAEHTLGPLHMDEAIPESCLPLRYVGFSTSFRREAGSYGKDTRGILRVHQFDKIEFESFSAPEHGLDEQDFFIALQEYLVQQLNIPYRIVFCSTGDQGDPDARHLDLEMWMPGQNKYRETHSADYMTDYQARRLGTRVRRADGATEFIHMNDATAFAIGRTLIAIMENYQTEDGRIQIPDVLTRYIGKEYIG